MLDKGLTIFRIRGIPVRLHVSLLVFLPYVAFVATRQIGAVASTLGIPREDFHLPPPVWGVILAVGLFVSVLIHETCHALVALRSGARVRSITLMMLGGVSLIEGDLPPVREAWMAFAGPLGSFALATVSWLVYRFAPLPPEALAALFAFAATNLVLGVFNLLPAFPMDGGRVLRGLLARWIGPERATRTAARIGRVMAIAFAVYAAVSFNLILLLIAWFVYAGSRAEESRLSLLHALEGVTVRDLMSQRLGEAGAEEPVREVLVRLIHDGLQATRVWGTNGAPDWHVLGVVTTEGLESAARHGLAGKPVGASLPGPLPEAHPWDEAAQALHSLSTGEAPVVVVVDATHEVVGVVTPNELERAALLGRQPRP